MEDFHVLLENIDKKTDNLIQNYQRLKTENESFKNLITQLKKENKNLKEEINQLKEKNKLLKISGTIKKTGNKEVKLKINELVREIDKCILQLNKQ